MSEMRSSIDPNTSDMFFSIDPNTSEIVSPVFLNEIIQSKMFFALECVSSLPERV